MLTVPCCSTAVEWCSDKNRNCVDVDKAIPVDADKAIHVDVDKAIHTIIS